MYFPTNISLGVSCSLGDFLEFLDFWIFWKFGVASLMGPTLG